MSRLSRADRPIAFSSAVQSLKTARLSGAWKARPIMHVGQHVEAAGQIELLEDHGAARAAIARNSRPFRRGDVDVAEADPPGARVAQPVDHAQQGRLARARLADHAQQLARRHFQRDLVDGALVAETSSQRLRAAASGPQGEDQSLLGSGPRLRRDDGLVTALIQRSAGVRCQTIAGDYSKVEAVSQFGRIVLAVPAARRNPRG